MFLITQDLDECLQSFETLSNLKVNEDSLNKLKQWLKDYPESKLDSFFSVLGYGSHSVCYDFGDGVVIKLSFLPNRQFLNNKADQYPVLQKYLVPTSTFTLPFSVEMSEEHYQFLTSHKFVLGKLPLQSITFQPKVKPITNHEELQMWRKHCADLCAYPTGTFDIEGTGNVGYLNRRPVLVDW